MIQQRECRVLCSPRRCFGLPHHVRAIFLTRGRRDTLGRGDGRSQSMIFLKHGCEVKFMEDGWEGGTGRWRLSRVRSSSTGRSVGSIASVSPQRHRNAGGSRGPPLDSIEGCAVWVRVAVPATQPALPGEAVSAQRRPGAQLCWEKLAGRYGISAIRSSRDTFFLSEPFRREELAAPQQSPSSLPATRGAGR